MTTMTTERNSFTKEERIEYTQFDIVWVDLPRIENTHLQCGRHPAVVMSNNKACMYSPNVTVLPLSSKIVRKYNPSHYILDINTAKSIGLYKPSVAKAEDLCPVPRENIVSVVGHIHSKALIEEIKNIINVYLGSLY